jgi:transposase InsO family protein
VAVDDHSRYAYVEVHPDEKGTSAAGFLLRAAAHFAERGIKVERVMSDNAKAYTDSRAFKAAVAEIRARHIQIRPYRPQTNGKAERFIQTMLREWAYVRLYRSNGDRLRALPYWVRRYNSKRPHTALGGRPPASRL